MTLLNAIVERIGKIFRSEEQQAYYDSYTEKCIELAKEKGEKDAIRRYQDASKEVNKDQEVE